MVRRRAARTGRLRGPSSGTPPRAGASSEARTAAPPPASPHVRVQRPPLLAPARPRSFPFRPAVLPVEGQEVLLRRHAVEALAQPHVPIGMGANPSPAGRPCGNRRRASPLPAPLLRRGELGGFPLAAAAHPGVVQSPLQDVGGDRAGRDHPVHKEVRHGSEQPRRGATSPPMRHPEHVVLDLLHRGLRPDSAVGTACSPSGSLPGLADSLGEARLAHGWSAVSVTAPRSPRFETTLGTSRSQRSSRPSVGSSYPSHRFNPCSALQSLGFCRRRAPRRPDPPSALSPWPGWRAGRRAG